MRLGPIVAFSNVAIGPSNIYIYTYIYLVGSFFTGPIVVFPNAAIGPKPTVAFENVAIGPLFNLFLFLIFSFELFV